MKTRLSFFLLRQMKNHLFIIYVHLKWSMLKIMDLKVQFHWLQDLSVIGPAACYWLALQSEKRGRLFSQHRLSLVIVGFGEDMEAPICLSKVSIKRSEFSRHFEILLSRKFTCKLRILQTVPGEIKTFEMMQQLSMNIYGCNVELGLSIQCMGRLGLCKYIGKVDYDKSS